MTSSIMKAAIVIALTIPLAGLNAVADPARADKPEAGPGCCGAARSCMACYQESAAPAKETTGTIETAALAALIKANTSVVILDARSGQWDDGHRIPGAKSLNAGSTDAEIASAVTNKTQQIVTYCAGLKCPASHQLAERLRALGYTNVLDYAEGIAGWTNAGNPVEKRK